MTTGDAPRAASAMDREIHDIPATVAALLDRVGPEVAAAAEDFRAERPAWITIVARGSSDHAAVYARYLIETVLGIPTGLAAPSVLTAYGARLRWADGAVIAISQSGQSTDVVEVARAARDAGAVTLAITNDPASPLAGAVHRVVLCRAGREDAVPATKTYVTQLVAAAAFVATLADDGALLSQLRRVPEVASQTLIAAERWIADPEAGGAAVDAIASVGRAIIVSRGFNLATALEIGLKLKETARVFAEAYSAADVLHGPMVLADDAVPMLVVRPEGPVASSIDAASAAAGRRGTEPWVIGIGEGGADRPRPRDLSLATGLQESLTPIVGVLPGYLLAEASARRLGLDPDAPAGLQKVTKTR